MGRTSRVKGRYFCLFVVVAFLLIFSPSLHAEAASLGVVNTDGSRLNVRASASTSAKIIGKLKDHETVTITGSSGSWYKVSFGSKTGYVAKQYVDTSGKKSSNQSSAYPQRLYVNTDGVKLNMRSGPSTSKSIVSKIPDGTLIEITGKYNSSWYTAKYKGASGYVYAKYISTTKGSAGSSAPAASQSSGYRKIQLNVKTYKQHSSTWKDVKIGNSRVTIDEVGCLVCAVASLESYTTGKNITPKYVAGNYTFSQGGSLYWPKGYVRSTSGNYLANIYKQLEKGNPVLIGAFNKQGDEHWVLVCGYKGSQKLSADNFVIMDPGYNTTSLSYFQNKYPVFKKIAYMA